MKIYNKHERVVNSSTESLAWTIDNPSGPDESFWPHEKWPPRITPNPIKVGLPASHSNGLVQYKVSEYIPGKRISYQFEPAGATAGLDGRHFLEIIARHKYTVIRHIVDADCSLKMWLRWIVFIAPVHNAIIEDTFDKVENRINSNSNKYTRWSLWVKFLRWWRGRHKNKLK
jgi:hypothetical protein